MNNSFSAQSDSPKKFSLQSHLIYAMWKSGAAYGGSDALFEVKTSFVGDGAEVKIKGKTENGKNLGKLDTKIFGNRLVAGFPIPEKAPADDYAYLEVQLPKQSLKGETNRIPIRPPIKVQQTKWSAKEARRGDTLTLSVDFQSDIPNDTDVLLVIYEYDPHQGLHDPVCKVPTTVQNKKIKVDWEYDYHTGTDQIPTHDELKPVGKSYAHPQYFFIVVLDEIKIGVNRESGLLKFKDWVEIEHLDPDGKPVPNQKYTILLPDGSKKSGTLDANGHARVDDIPPGRIDVEFPPDDSKEKEHNTLKKKQS
jgi:hypothetical protein